MEVRTKKRRKQVTMKMLTGGRIEEVCTHDDLRNSNQDKVSICFRGRISSGIIQLTKEEASDLHKVLGKSLNLVSKTC